MALPRGRRIGRGTRIGLVVLAACLAVWMIAGPTGAAIAKKHGSSKLSLSFKSKSQSDQGLLSAGKVKVIVASLRGGLDRTAVAGGLSVIWPLRSSPRPR
jgi:hypothetical protein